MIELSDGHLTAIKGQPTTMPKKEISIENNNLKYSCTVWLCQCPLPSLLKYLHMSKIISIDTEVFLANNFILECSTADTEFKTLLEAEYE